MARKLLSLQLMLEQVGPQSLGHSMKGLIYVGNITKVHSTVALLSKLVVVVIQFLSNVVPLAETAGFTPFLLQLLALRPSTCLVSEHPLFSNQSSLFPLPPASSRSFSVVLAFSCHLLQDLDQPSKHYRHSSSAHVHTILLHLLLLCY